MLFRPGTTRVLTALTTAFAAGSVALSGAVAATPASATSPAAPSLQLAAATTAARPSGTTTGPRAGVVLKIYNGNYDARRDGTVISGLHITGRLFAHANNLRVVDSVIDGGIAINVNAQGGQDFPVKAHMTFSHVRTTTADSVGLEDVRFDACHFGGVSDTFMQASMYADRGITWAADRLTVTNSLFDHLLPAAPGGKHLEAVHLMGVTNVVFRNNYFHFVAPDNFTFNQTTAVVTLESRFLGTLNRNVILDGNTFVGGGYYQLYAYGPGITVTNNKFSRPAASVQYPPSAYASSGLAWYPITQSGNRAYHGLRPFSLSNH